MEHEALVFEGTWSTFDPSMSVGDSEVMKQYLYGAHSVTNEQDQDPSIMLWSDHSAHSYCSDNTDYNPFYWPQGNSSISTASACSYLFPLANYGGSYNVSDHNMGLAANISSVPVEDLRIGEGQITAPSFPVDPYHQFNQPVCMTEEISSNEVGESFEKAPFLLLPSHHSCKATKKRRSICDFEMPEMTRGEDCQIVSPKKKARAFTSVPKKAKNAKSKKVQKSARTTNEEESNVDTNAQSSSCYSSEDDSNGSQELNGSSTTNSNSNKSAALNLHAKTRAVHGSASDPQSLHARKRRERINERLRILQKLIPNGTKVDISTMLEEAVQYVKFLQLQIKLLSSDDLWMYAPIAYNGMNIGFDVKISPSSQK